MEKGVLREKKALEQEKLKRALEQEKLKIKKLENELSQKDDIINKFSEYTQIDVDDTIDSTLDDKIISKKNEFEKKDTIIKKLETELKNSKLLAETYRMQSIDDKLKNAINDNLSKYNCNDVDIAKEYFYNNLKLNYTPDLKNGKLILKDGADIENIIKQRYEYESANEKFSLFKSNIMASGPDNTLDDGESVKLENVEKNSFLESITNLNGFPKEL